MAEIFEIGDRIKTGSIICGLHLDEGDQGTVLKVENNVLSIEFDKEIEGAHGCDGLGKFGHCWRLGCGGVIKLKSKKATNKKGVSEMSDAKKDIFLEVFGKDTAEDYAIVKDNMSTDDDFIKQLVIKANKDAILKEAKKRKKDKEAKE